jgi:MoaD family protein
VKLTFIITGFLTDFSNGERQIQIESQATTIADALNELWERHVGLRDRVVNEKGEQRPHVNIFLNNENVRRLQGLQTTIGPNDEITILPAVSGG